MIGGAASALAFIAIFYFISKMLTAAQVPLLASDNRIDYFTSVYIGFVSAQYFINPIIALNSNVRNAQLTGILEHITGVGVPVSTYIIFHALADFLRTTVMIVLYAIAGKIIFGINLEAFNPGIFLIFFILIVPFYYCVAIIVAELTLFFKELGHIDLLVRNFVSLFSGIFFSTKLLPFPIDMIKEVVPVFRCVDVARMIFMTRVNYAELFYNIEIIAAYFAVILLISILLMRTATVVIKKNGSLVSH
jgi:ABC-type polysaccharide/polyol phosphate export permease